MVGILQVIVGLQVFDLLYTLTNGGPGRATYVLIYAIYNLAFGDVSLGYASAVTVILFFIIVLSSMLLLLFQVRRRAPDRPGRGRGGRARGRAAELGAPRPLGGCLRRADARRPRETRTRRGGRRFRLPPRVGRVAVRRRGRGTDCSSSSRRSSGSIDREPPDRRRALELPPHLSLNLWLDGYVRLIQARNWQGSLFVSLSTAVLTTILAIVLAAPAAYSLARFHLPGKRTILAILIFLQMVPAIVMAIPVLRIFQILGLKDTIASLVIVNVAFWLPLIVWLLRNFFADVPVSPRARRADRRLLPPRHAVPGHDPGRAAGHRRGRDPDPDRDLERVPVRGDPRRPQRRHDHPADHGDHELPDRAQRVAAAEPAGRRRDGRRHPRA